MREAEGERECAGAREAVEGVLVACSSGQGTQAGGGARRKGSLHAGALPHGGRRQRAVLQKDPHVLKLSGISQNSTISKPFC
jgi:hypothetical protein